MTSSCQIVPPYIFEALAASDDPVLAQRARESMRHADELRAHRHGVGPSPQHTPKAQRGTVTAPRRTIADAKGKQTTPGTTVRTEGAAPTGDAAADEAYDGLGDTWSFYSGVFQRNSIDGKGLALLATVHYGSSYDNAFWDGSQMVFGDGDGVVFGRFTRSVDVIGHELTHGVTQFTAGLNYQDQSGALNESVSDVFGSLVKQYALGQAADAADWLIGADLLEPGIKGRALRDMLHPGTAYDDPQLGRDPQPADMSGYVETSDDNGGVHLNSGIPNRAFALAATTLGGKAWETVGPVWYAVLTGAGIGADCDFATFAGLTIAAAESSGGAGSDLATAVRQGWETVGVLAAASAGGEAGDASATGAGSTDGAEASPIVASPAPAGSEEVPDRFLLRRSGGFAGTTRERRVRLSDLPDTDTSAWETLLASPTLRDLAVERLAQQGRADGFTYSVIAEQTDLHVTVAEPHIPGHVQDLFERTLRG